MDGVWMYAGCAFGGSMLVLAGFVFGWDVGRGAVLPGRRDPKVLIDPVHHAEVVKLLGRLATMPMIMPDVRQRARLILEASGQEVPAKRCPGGRCDRR